LETYEVVAKTDRAVEKNEMRPMLRALLAERFKLACHRETREIAGLALTEAKGGHKMKQPDSEDQPSLTMPELADVLAFELRIPVADVTGLKGRYYFTFALLRPHLAEFRGIQPYDPVAAFQAGLQKAMGLKLESHKAPLEVLVIDHAEKKPVEN
jgi:hypothetical protein